MLAELIALHTADGLTHHGAVYSPAGRARKLAIVHIHGMTGSFIGEIEGALPPMFAEAGYACLAANNRGHGFGGAATEQFAGCLPDIQAAMDFMEARGFDRIALIGHSKGGVKVTYYMTQHPDPRVAALGILSPADNVRGVALWLGPQVAGKRWLTRMRKLVAEGKGQTMFTFPEWPYLISAATLLDHYSVTGDDVFESLPAIRVPVFAACGEKELDWCTTVARLHEAPPPGYAVHVIPRANHVYAGEEAELACLLIAWLDSVALA